MANLLPKKERNFFKYEYRFRLFSVILLFFIATSMLGMVFLLPSYFVSSLKEESIVRQFGLLKKTIELREEGASVESLLIAKQKINELVIVDKQVSNIKILQAIMDSMDDNVSVDVFYYTKGSEKKGKMRIAGIAESRAAFISFSDRLKKENSFNMVDFPVSSLAKDSDIPFSLILNINF